MSAKTMQNTLYHNFILGQVLRPYQSMIGYEKTIEELRYVPFSKNKTTFNYFELQNYAWEDQYKEWFNCVLDRLSKVFDSVDYSFFPENDFFATTLKRRMIESGIVDKSPFNNLTPC